jgi:hypothetical protein
MPKEHHNKMASIFKVALAATSPLPTMVYYFIGCIEEDAKFAHNCEIKAIEDEATAKIIENTSLGIESRTKGLLAVAHRRFGDPDYGMSQVKLLHMTIQDFITESNQVNSILENALDPAQDLSSHVCHAPLAFMKNNNKREDLEAMREIGLEIFYHASYVENILSRMWDSHPILDQAGNTFYGDGWQTRPPNIKDICSYAAYAAEYGKIEKWSRIILAYAYYLRHDLIVFGGLL